MPVTNYYSVGGEILGEETGGVRRDYLTDALGSVTGTVTSAGAIENTYRYKPYGAQLSKTGSGTDPAFTWVGKWGYRQTNKNYSDVYVRSRNYSTLLSKWIQRDPLNHLFQINLWMYSSNDPILRIDILGLEDRKIDKFTKCYAFDAKNQTGDKKCGSGYKGNDALTIDAVKLIVDGHANKIDCFYVPKVLLFTEYDAKRAFRIVMTCITRGESDCDPHCVDFHDENIGPLDDWTFGLFQNSQRQHHNCGGGAWLNNICDPNLNTEVAINLVIGKCKRENINISQALKGIFGVYDNDFPIVRKCSETLARREKSTMLWSWEYMVSMLSQVSCYKCKPLGGCP